MRRQARKGLRSEGLTPSDVRPESTGGTSVAPGAAFVAQADGDVYYWVGSTGWHDIPALDRVWFPSEQAAQEAGYRRAASAWEPLDEFEILGELGRGGTSVVYHAWDRGLGREVAIKVIQAYVGGDPETALRFALEARLLASLRHPNIVSAFAVKQLHGGSFALVMEYVRGRTLRDVIEFEAPLAPKRVESILRDVASGLAAAHQHGIVHRDVKPDNIFLEAETGRALLADFGIAVNVHAPSGLTMSGTAVGTPNYMSPEQIDSRRLDGRSDLYSLALIGWEMMTAEKPWQGESLYSVIYKQKHEDLPTLRRVRTDVPVRLAFAIEGALAKDPAARWASAEVFIQQLADQSLSARWRHLSALVLWKRRASARVAAATARIQNGALETAKTVLFRRPEHVGSGPLPDGARSDPRARRLRGTGFATALVLLLMVVLAGLRNPFAPARPDASSELDRGGPGDPLVAPTPEAPAEVGAQLLPLTDSSAFGADSAGVVLAALAEIGDAALPISSVSDTAGAEEPSAPGGLPPDSASRETAATGVGGPPTAAAPLLLEVARSRSRIAAGGLHTCEIDSGQRVRCWGGNDRAQLGGAGPRRATSALPVAALNGVQAIEAGGFHTCVLRALGAVFCWGDNGDGQLGGGAVSGDGVVGVTARRFTDLALGSAHSCGLGTDGAVYCWGSNANGQLGDATTTSRAEPTRVRIGGGVARLAAGWSHTCALSRERRARCWGDNASGQLGDGTTTGRTAPVSVAGDQAFRAITAGSSHTCALTAEGIAFCWGQNSAGQLGDGTTANRARPALVTLHVPLAEISAGGRHTCAVARDGSGYCWGQNNYGQLGIGSNESVALPTRVATDVLFTTIRSSGSHTCGVSVDGASYCWGYNVEGQVGDGTQLHRTTPQRVPR
jgi:serine/threonine protein kinase